MNKGIRIQAVAILCISVFAPAAEGLWEDLVAAPDIAMGMANGRAAAFVNGAGAVVDFRWPGLPGQPQLVIPKERNEDVPTPPGMQWGLRLQGRAYWQAEHGDAPEWRSATAVTGAFSAPPLDDPASYTVELPADADGIVTQLVVPPHDEPVTVYWYGHVTPRTQPVPAFSFADWLAPGRGGFVGFISSDDGLLRYFRPRSPGVSTRNRADIILRTEAPGPRNPWNRLGEGTWVTVETDPPHEGFQVGLPHADDHTARCAFDEASAGALSGDRSAIGPANAVLSWRFPPSDSPRRVTVSAGFGVNFDESKEALDGLRALGEEEEAWELQDGLTGHARRILSQAVDPRTGAVASRVDGPPPRYLIVPRHGHSILAALHAADMEQTAEAYMETLLEAVRLDNQPGAPAGSLPAALHHDGAPAVPDHVLDIMASAAFVRAAERHRRRLDGDRRSDFVDGAWPALEAAADFLATWRDGRTWQPLPAFDPERMRDIEQPALTLTLYLALRDAGSFASAAGRPAGLWEERRDELEAVARYAGLDDPDYWRPGEVLEYWEAGELLFDDEAWAAFAQDAIDALPQFDGEQAAAVLYHLAAYASARGEPLDALREAVDSHGAAVLGLEPDGDAWVPGEGPIPDPYAASLIINALDLLNAGQ